MTDDELNRFHHKIAADAVIALGDVLDRLSKLHFQGEGIPPSNPDSLDTYGFKRGPVGRAEAEIRKAIHELRCYRDGQPSIVSRPEVVVVERHSEFIVVRCCYGSHVRWVPSLGKTGVKHYCSACRQRIDPKSRVWRSVRRECAKMLICDSCASGVTDLLKKVELQ
jgi:hypothetical protein